MSVAVRAATRGATMQHQTAALSVVPAFLFGVLIHLGRDGGTDSDDDLRRDRHGEIEVRTRGLRHPDERLELQRDHADDAERDEDA